MQRCYVYEIAFPSGKKYVGISIDPHRRLAEHIRVARKGSSNRPIYNAIRAHGLDNLKWRVLLCCSVEFAKEMEIALISAWGTMVLGGYNVCFGGDIAPTKAPIVR